MKTKIKRHSRSALSILLTVCMLISCMTVGLIATDAAKVTDSGTVGAKAYSEVGATADDSSVGYSGFPVGNLVYFKPNSNWLSADAWFAIKATGAWDGSGTKWVKMDEVETGVYSAVVPTNSNGNCDYVQFVRMNKDKTALESASAWNWSVNIETQDSDTNCYDASSFSGYSNLSGTWSTYTPPVATTYSVTVKCGEGKFTVANNQTDQTVYASENNAATLPEVTPPSGKKFKEWTKTGSVTLNNAESNGSATVNATAAGGTVTATYEDIAVTTIYIAKNDNVKNIYVWDNNGNIIEGDFPGKVLDTTVYEFGGVNYYKYTTSAQADSFNFIVNNGSNARQSQDAKNYAAGHTYYVQWYGTGTNADVKKMGTDWYPKYYLAYKPSSAEDIAANWTRVAFSNSEATLSSLTAQNYVFYIVRQDMVNSSYADRYWYNNGDKTITRSNRTNVYTTHDNNAPNITLTADAPGDYKVVFDAMNGDDAVTIHADYPVGYRAVGNATFFGTAWDTTSSNYEYMLTPLASAYTYNGNEYTYSCSKKLNSSVGTFEFKVWDSNGDWHPAGAGTDISVTNGVKRGQTITFYYNPTSGNVTYKITGEPSGESWPPTEIQTMMDASGDGKLVEQDLEHNVNQYNTLIYKIATGSNAIASSPSTFSPLYQKAHPGDDGAWWADFTSVLPSVGTDQLYFNITSDGSYTGFYSNIADETVTGGNTGTSFDLSEAPGITVKKTDKDGKKFVEVSGVDSRVTNLGVYITKNGSDFTYKFFTIKGSTSASKTVKIYAKDGAIRRNGTARDPKSNMDYSTFEKYANTFIYSDSGNTTRFTGTVRSSTHGATGNDELNDDTDVFDRYNYDYVPSVEKGTTIYIKTVLKDDTYMNNYYLVLR